MTLFLATIGTLLAQTPQETVGTVGSSLPGLASTCQGACAFVDLAQSVIAKVRPALLVFAVFVIALQGFRMIITQDEEVFSKGRGIIASALTGIVLAYIITPFINAFYGTVAAPGSIPQGNMIVGEAIVSREVIGIIRWAETIVASLAVLMLVISGFRAMIYAGSEEGVTQLRRTVFGVVGGIFLLLLTEVAKRTLGLQDLSQPNPNEAIVAAVQIAAFFLGFLALVALVIVVYAGFLMIFSLGNDERVTQAKSLLIRAGIGFLVILVSFALVQFVIAAAVGA
jgi:hypothetical protein